MHPQEEPTGTPDGAERHGDWAAIGRRVLSLTQRAVAMHVMTRTRGLAAEVHGRQDAARVRKSPVVTTPASAAEASA